MDLRQDEINYAASQIAKIDSGERHVFLENVNTENQFQVKVFTDNGMTGAFFSCRYSGKLRIHIAFEEDTDKFNEEIVILIKSSIDKGDPMPVMIWLRNENRKIIEYLKDKFNIAPDYNQYYYASAEYIMRRENLNKEIKNTSLEIRPYEEKYIDEYLNLLDVLMTFEKPAPNYIVEKAHYIKRFIEYRDKNSFEAFWNNNELIGLYWRKDAEIDHIAVSVNHQRTGYGSAILTRAIEMVFRNTDKEYAYLYAVDWNDKGRAFYEKYGMEKNGHSYLLRINSASK